MTIIRWAILCISLSSFVLARALGAEPLPLDLLPVDASPPQHTVSTFYSVQRLWMPPMPFNWLADDTNVVLYVSPSRGTNVFFVGDLEVDYARRSAEAQAERFLMNTLDGPPPLPEGEGSGGGSGGGTNSFTCPYGTNDFWLEATLTNANLSLLVHTTNRTSAFDIFWTPSVPATNGWWWIARGLPGQLCFDMPMTNLSGTMGFFAAGTTNGMDAQGITDACRLLVGANNVLTNDLDQDSLPDWWEIKYFGDLSASGNQSNLDALNSGTDPNVLSFTFSFAGHRINSPQVTLQPEVLSGIPSYYALLVNDTNFDTPFWTKFDGPVAFTLGSTDGVYRVMLGLKGRAADSTITWLGTSVELDRVAPLVTITGPLASDQSKSPIQLKGNALEPLRSVVYSLSSVAGTSTNLPGLLTGPANFQTNDFQLLDVPLASGSNLLSIAATDLAGNVTITNLTYHLQLDTNPPNLQLYWPQHGAQIGAASFTLRGWLNDETASVTARITRSDGTTCQAGGLVERNGKLWIEDLPLGDGTNYLTLAVTNAAGYSSITNLSVVKSAVVVTIDHVPQAQLSQPTVTVTGGVSDDAYKIWVNGVGVFPTNGAWTAYRVPVTSGGTAVFAVTAIPISDNGGDGTPPQGGGEADAAALNPTSPQAVASPAQEDQDMCWDVVHGEWEDYEEDVGIGGYYSWHYVWNWDEIKGGYALYTGTEPPGEEMFGLTYRVDTNGVERFEEWLASTNNVVSTNRVDLGEWFWPGWTIKGPTANGELAYMLFGNGGYSLYHRTARNVKIRLRTGGKSGVGRQSLFSFTGSARELVTPFRERDIPKTEISIPGINTSLGADGRAYAVLADGSEDVNITPVASRPYYTFDIVPAKHKLKITANATALEPDRATTNAQFCVGQNVSFALSGLPSGVTATNHQWTLDGNYVNKCIPPPNSNSSAIYTNDASLRKNAVLHTNWWVSGEYIPLTKMASLTCTLVFTNGNPTQPYDAKGLFTMHRPRVVNYTLANTFLMSLWHGHVFGTEPALGGNGNDRLGCFASAPQYYVSIDSKHAGDAAITQLINGYMTNECPEIFNSGGTNQLDTAEFPDIPGAKFKTSVTAGSPSESTLLFVDGLYIQCVGHTAVSIESLDYIRFKPAEGNSIYVTLGKVNWGLSGWTDYSTLTNSLHDYLAPLPANSPPITLPPQRSQHLDSGVSDSDEFPQWDSIAKGEPDKSHCP
jgi:hypothetical protein